MTRLTVAENAEREALQAKVSVPDAEGRYPHWNQAERDRWRDLARKASPGIQFAPSTEEQTIRAGYRYQPKPIVLSAAQSGESTKAKSSPAEVYSDG